METVQSSILYIMFVDVTLNKITGSDSEIDCDPRRI